MICGSPSGTSEFIHGNHRLISRKVGEELNCKKNQCNTLQYTSIHQYMACTTDDLVALTIFAGYSCPQADVTRMRTSGLLTASSHQWPLRWLKLFLKHWYVKLYELIAPHTLKWINSVIKLGHFVWNIIYCLSRIKFKDRWVVFFIYDSFCWTKLPTAAGLGSRNDTNKWKPWSFQLHCAVKPYFSVTKWKMHQS